VVAALRYLFGQADDEMAAKFFEGLASGVGLSGDSVIRLLRERLIASAASKHKLPQYEMCALFVKAWNAYIKGEKITVLKFRDSGKASEDMPAIVGLDEPMVAGA
jgi:hypothetical protein